MRAEAATKSAFDDVAAGRAPNLKPAVWAEAKRFLLRTVFDGKCAYCEGAFEATGFGDAEHWRPKGAVDEYYGDWKVRRVVDSEGAPHPGYWWLAYSWENLLPACERCNSGRGKNCLFPIQAERQFVADPPLDTATLDALEQPLVLHPFTGEDPAEHLVFDDVGQVHAEPGSSIGSVSIRVFDLEREPLQRARRRRQEEARTGFLAALLVCFQNGDSLDHHLARFTRPDAEYSLAVRQFLHRQREAFGNKILP